MSHLAVRLAVLFMLACPIAWAHDSPPASNADTVAIDPGLGRLHHPVSTKNAEAQQYFDQGLRLIYAFNHDESARAFRKAGKLESIAAAGQQFDAAPLAAVFDFGYFPP